jgi:acyl-CoA synthetase (AMP-forming)/AMP-acid ligase II
MRKTLKPERTIWDPLLKWVRETPERQVYTFLADGEVEDESLSFSDLNRRASAIANLLRRSCEPSSAGTKSSPGG